MNEVIAFSIAIAALLLAVYLSLKVLGLRIGGLRMAAPLVRLLRLIFGISYAPLGGQVQGGSAALQSFPLARAVRLYASLAACWILVKVALIALAPPVLLGTAGFIVVHLAFGYVLNRRLLPCLRWAHWSNSLSTLARMKLFALLFWPLTYPILFVQISIARYL